MQDVIKFQNGTQNVGQLDSKQKTFCHASKPQQNVFMVITMFNGFIKSFCAF